MPGQPQHIPRVPEGVDQRLRRFVDGVQKMYNSLVDGGFLILDTDAAGNVVLRIKPIAESGIGPPAASLGYAGSIYFDVTDPSDPLMYFKA